MTDRIAELRALLDYEGALDDTDIDALLDCAEALKAYERVFDALFAQCLSNGVFDAWGGRFDCTTLNEAHRKGSAALARLNGGSDARAALADGEARA